MVKSNRRASGAAVTAKRYGRNTLLMCAVLLMIAAMAPRFVSVARAQSAIHKGGNYLVYVGTYTANTDDMTPTGSMGIYSYRFDAATGKVEPLGIAAVTGQPSFLAVDPADKFLYSVNEMDTYYSQPGGAASAFSINGASGKLTLLNQVASGGGSPAHIAVDHTGKYVAVSNYNGGNLAIFPILDDGKLGKPAAFIQHHGSSVNKDRQASPHVHEVIFSPDNRFILSADLGLDEVFVYPFDEKKGALGEPRTVRLPPGSGPRHLAFGRDGKFVYLTCEMGSIVAALSFHASDGALAVLQTVPLAPAETPASQKSGAEIAVSASGAFLYASNRFDNLIGVYSIDATSGKLKQIQSVALAGKTPRSFSLDPSGKWLWDANEDSNDITLYKVDPTNGKLLASGIRVNVPAPTCVVFIPI